MAGGGTIIEKAPHFFSSEWQACVRYRVMSECRLGWFDETFVCAAPDEDEPQVGDVIWWGSEQRIYWGDNDSKALKKVGYSWSVK